MFQLFRGVPRAKVRAAFARKELGLSRRVISFSLIKTKEVMMTNDPRMQQGQGGQGGGQSGQSGGQGGQGGGQGGQGGGQGGGQR